MDPDEEEAGKVPEAMSNAVRVVSDKASRIGLHTRNAMVMCRTDEEGVMTPTAFIDFVIGDLAYSPAVQAPVPVETERSMQELEDSIEEDEFDAILRRREERRPRA